MAGGTGIVGSGIAEALLKAGAKVWISSRDETKINEFKLSLPEKLRDKLSGIKGEVTVENDIVRIRDTILKQDAKIDHVISSLGILCHYYCDKMIFCRDFKSMIFTYKIGKFFSIIF